jgi:hypothetical protein
MTGIGPTLSKRISIRARSRLFRPEMALNNSSILSNTHSTTAYCHICLLKSAIIGRPFPNNWIQMAVAIKRHKKTPDLPGSFA